MAILLKNITPLPSISTSLFLIRLVLSSLGLLYEASLFSMGWQKKLGFNGVISRGQYKPLISLLRLVPEAKRGVQICDSAARPRNSSRRKS